MLLNKSDKIRVYSRSSGLRLAILIALGCAPNISFAAPPIVFDDWANTAGDISATCPTGFQCGAGVVDDGMLQRTVRDLNGDEFIQLILDDMDALGTRITTESFIRINGASGISSKQTISTNGADNLLSTTILNTGWANNEIDPTVLINQTLTSVDASGAGIDNSFNFEVYEDVNGNPLGRFIDITDTTLDSSLLSANPTTGQDIQKFVYRRASGNQVPTAGSVTLPSAMGMGGGMMGGGMMGGGAGGTMDWLAGDDVEVIWVGQICDGCQDGMMGGGMGGGMMGNGADVTFSYQSFDNLVDAFDPIATASIVSTDPFDWADPPFGLQPSLL